jgi:GT2 family glycosyltransferase
MRDALTNEERVPGMSCVVLSYQRADLFQRLAESLPAVSEAIVDRVLVQHGTDRETLDLAEQHDWTTLVPGSNLSFSAGNNLGVSATHSTHVLLLNNDAVVTPEAIDALWQRRAHPIVGSVLVQSDGSVNHAGGCFRWPDLLPVHIGRGLPPETIDEDLVVPWVTFAAVLIERTLWDELHGLDEGYHYGFEDVTFCLRAAEQGVRCVVAHDARITHDEFGTRERGGDAPNLQRFAADWMVSRRLHQALGIAVG